MRNIEIREVTINDADFLFDLMNNADIRRALYEPSTCKQDWIEAIQAWADDDDEVDYIIWKDGIQIGWFAFNGLQSTDGTIYLKMAVILPEFQHRGIGTYVLSQLLDNVRSKGYTSVALFTNQNNICAQKCYTKCGFEIIQELPERMSDGTTVQRYKMECRL